MRHASIVLIVGTALLRTAPGAAGERIWLEAEINGKPARLCFDSGLNAYALSPRALKKLGLMFIPAPTNDFSHGLLAGDTEDCTLTLEGTKCKTSFLVLDLPAYVSEDFDGAIGWPATGHNVLRIDAVAREVTFLPKVPTESAKWARFSLHTNFGTLDLQIPLGDRTNGFLCVDTGSDDGFALPAREWGRWREANPKSPTTLKTTFNPEDGFFVQPESWADQISIGPIIVTGLPIARSCSVSATRRGAQYEGTLGLAALKRMDLIVDGKNGLAYLRAKKTRPPAYQHNRLGAVFVPMGTHTNQAVARVVEGGPAYGAGVRDGDVLLRVDGVAVTNWNDTWLSRFSMSAGTRLSLTLDREGKIFKTTATLRQILRPNSNASK